MDFTQQQLNEAAHVLRELIDREHNWLVDIDDKTIDEADAELKPCYDAVTNLHEAASKAAV